MGRATLEMLEKYGIDIEYVVPQDESVLDEAARIVAGKRTEMYGEPEDALGMVAAVWNALLADRLTRPLEPYEVATMMVALKAGRQMKSYHRDNFVDMAGYAELGDIAYQKGPDDGL